MRIAVIQLQVVPGHRAATLQAVLAAVDHAAENEPSPELIILPAFGDVPHLLAGRSLPGEAIQGPIVAACAYHARQWGVWIAFGMAERAAEKPFVTSLLLDADGDVHSVQRQKKFGATGRGRFATGDGVGAFDTQIGRIALVTGEDVFDATEWPAAGDVDLVISTGCFGREARSPIADTEAALRRLSELAVERKACCAIADVTTALGARPDCAGFSMVIGSDGSTLAAAKSRESAVLFVQVPVSIRHSSAAGTDD